MLNLEIALIILFSYLFGSIPFGLILTKIFVGKDIRKIGSGNIGATNVLRSGNIALIKDILQIEKIKDRGDTIFYEFKEYDYKKIVLKRPIKSELLDNKYNYQIKGKSTRFDVYI